MKNGYASRRSHFACVHTSFQTPAEHVLFLALPTEQLGAAYVTSSGTTDGLETYDFDVFANEIYIQGVFSADAQTISVSEVRESSRHGRLQCIVVA